MKNLAVILRASQLYAHMAHNLTTGCSFFSDHEAFAGFYGEYEKDYDAVVERIIGLTGDCDITAITKSACDIVEKTKFKDTMHAYSVLLATEKSICEVCAAENKKASLGSQNLLQAIADKSEMRQYKIQRRIKDV